MKDEDNIIFLDDDQDGQDAGLMYSPVMAEPELPQDSPPAQREEGLSSVYNQVIINLIIIIIIIIITRRPGWSWARSLSPGWLWPPSDAESDQTKMYISC